MSTEFKVGDRVRVIKLPPYVKTAEPMPMLRPPEVIHIGEEGVILDRRPGGYWGVRFAKGAFLLDSQYLEAVTITSEKTDPMEESS
ncbi:MAG: DUF3148 domain-containing protein [Symploca sp. SIO3C6]|uniref:DUF3148 domain-containing protein n=1 Tax=Symploca sp. SIO1C4 TaxID=2607765 RepID=A0A6B3NFG6_9CYAN|nr:DUF3148 domain-containing protein [Symploca sp. SIO3C6]NER30397.1 DUF3148 domain-containing protein [Symploca sp. SIO1C4]NET07125.1 DUF3148 domain-containing protein [Symploca sp. SIO2B6]